jgi:RNA polymerase sigma-70 factor (ECF subfamily)
VGELAMIGASPETSLDQKRAEELLVRLLGGLSPELRTAFVLHEVEGQTLAEIAQILGIPPGTAASRVRRAREEFNARLERHRRNRGDDR